jgi:hypothetical protein
MRVMQTYRPHDFTFPHSCDDSKARNTIESYFHATDTARVQPNVLRKDSKFSESTDWNHVKQRFAISDRHVLELKSIANDFKSVTTREYDCIIRFHLTERSFSIAR